MENLENVVKNIELEYDRRRAAVFALASDFAGRAIETFRTEQQQNRYWRNQTKDAMNRMFSEPFKQDNVIGFGMAHGVDYGVYLELANDGRNQAIRPIMQRYSLPFVLSVKELFGDAT